MLTTEALSESTGIEILDLDLREALDEAAVSEILALVHGHGVVRIRNQRLTPPEFNRFGARFGAPIRHIEKDLRLDGLPEIMCLSNADDRDDRQLNGGAFWHTDLVFTDEPASLTMLHAVAVPRQGGETMFADQLAAYDALDQAMKQRIENLVTVHCYEGRTDGSMPSVHHPLVRKHPVTGRKAIYGAGGTPIGIVDMPEGEARELLDELAAHATDPRFVYSHRYALNDVVIWDNAITLHAAARLERSSSPEDDRIMHRVSVRGWRAAAADAR